MDGQRVVAITGSSRGMGRALAERFASDGNLVVGCSRGTSTLEHIPSYHHWTLDVTDETAVRGWAREVSRRFGKTDVLVCNVGLVKLGAMIGLTTLVDFQAFVSTILTGTFLVCREFSKQMAVSGSGRIVNVTSIMTELNAPGTVAYASAKSGVITLSKVLAAEMAGTGVTCNVVSPSVIAGESASSFGEPWMTRMLAMQTIRRAIDVDDIYRIIAFFASAGAGNVTGQVIHTCLVD